MARGRKTSFTIRLTPAERLTLLTWQRSTTISAGVARRARLLVLLAVVLQISGFSQMRLLGGYIDLIPLVVAAAAIYSGSVAGAVMRFSERAHAFHRRTASSFPAGRTATARSNSRIAVTNHA